MIGLPAHFFDTLGRLEAYPDNEIKAVLQDIRLCFKAITFSSEIMKLLKNAISMCSKFFVIFLPPATIPASAVAVPSSDARTDHLQNDNDDEGILLNIYLYFFASYNAISDSLFSVFFFFLERPARINIRYLSVGMSESAVLGIIYKLFDGKQICAYPILTKDEIQACLKTSHVFGKDAKKDFNKMFGTAPQFVNRNTTKPAADQMKGKLRAALEGTNLHYVTFAESEFVAQPISMCTSQKFCEPSCIFQISSDHVNDAERSLREAERLNGDVTKITAMKNAVVSAKLRELSHMIRTCIDNVDSVSQLNGIRDIIKCVPIEFKQAPNGSTVRAERPLKFEEELHLTVTGVLRLCI